VRTKCDSFVFGQTLCWEAFSKAANACPLPPSVRSEIRLSARCLGDTAIRFTLENIGGAATQAVHTYRIIRNTEEFQTGSFELAAGESTNLEVQADGATYRMEATKRDDGSRTAVALENCDGLTPGQINAFWLETGPLAYDFACSQVIGAFDPNRKTALPSGAGPANFIEANQPIRYTIEFQNTGTDTAYRVLLQDILPQNLELASFRPVAASDSCTWEIRNGGFLEVLFSPIMLPDSFANEPASHGFFSFEIEQTPDLPEGWNFDNRAYIQFDFNPAISTNSVHHTIGHLSIFVATGEPVENTSAWQVRGNPTRDVATFRTEQFIPGRKRFTLCDAAGHLLRSAEFSGQEFEFQRDGLASGLYFFRISDAQGRVFAGKIVVAE
ncbi:MAG: hypothetical protein ABIQ93_11615, partial [Saprospiraceae bacterium]